MTDPHLFAHLAEGAAVLLAAAAAFVAARRARSPQSRAARLWQPLAPIVSGKTQGDTLRGTYESFPVTARLASESGSATTFFYELTLALAPGGENWQVLYTGQKFLGGGEQTWRVKAKDAAFAHRLEQEGAAQTASAFPHDAQVTFTAKAGTLSLRTAANSVQAVPSVEAFVEHLTHLTELARMNAAAQTRAESVPH